MADFRAERGASPTTTPQQSTDSFSSRTKRDDVIEVGLCGLQGGEHSGGATEMQESAAVGGDMLVVARAEAEKSAERLGATRPHGAGRSGRGATIDAFHRGLPSRHVWSGAYPQPLWPATRASRGARADKTRRGEVQMAAPHQELLLQAQGLQAHRPARRQDRPERRRKHPSCRRHPFAMDLDRPQRRPG